MSEIEKIWLCLPVKICRCSLGQNSVAHVGDQLQDLLVDRVRIQRGCFEFFLGGALRFRGPGIGGKIDLKFLS